MSSKIKILEKSVALKIAAGEVIERPSSVLRELLDNSIDAGSTETNVYLTSSGMDEIRVIDNGSGMTREDLEICFLPHATSKIEQIEDIYKIFTLGFRGEALSSIASSARTEIISSTDDSGEGCTLKLDSGRHEISNTRANKGTIVSVKELFHMFPARKKFLKSPSAETGMCKTTFLEKAASNPEITFRLFIENKLTFFLPASDLTERIALSYPTVFKQKKMCSEIEYTEPSFSIKGILNSPELTRKDRKYIHIYINGRRIQEYSLVQAVIYGYSSFIPGGVFPSAVIFIDVDPELVDFNIHPAKKEARIKNIRIIHHALSETVAGKLKSGDLSVRFDLGRNAFSSPRQIELEETGNHENISPVRRIEEISSNIGKSDTAFSSNEAAYEKHEYKHENTGSFSNGFKDDEIKSSVAGPENNIRRRPLNRNSSSEYRENISFYKKASENRTSGYSVDHQGITDNISPAETDDINFISDLTRIESEDFQKQSSTLSQNNKKYFRYIGSLFNLFLICEKDDDMYLIDQHAADERIIYEKLSRNRPDIQPLLIPLYPEDQFKFTEEMISDYEKLGIIFKKDETGDYFIDAMPAYCSEIKNDVMTIIKDSPGNIEEIRKNLYATVSCKKAVKKGDILTEEQALAIIQGAFSIDIPFCPHGRPIWKKISKQELLEEINRIV